MLYRIVKNKPHPHIHRYHELVIIEELIFACKIKWITEFIFLFCKNCHFKTQQDETEVCCWGRELSEEWCKIYEVKKAEDVWIRHREARRERIKYERFL